MRTILIFIQILTFNVLNAQIHCYDNFSQRDSLMYFGNDSIPFSGLYKEYYPGKVKRSVEFKDGIINGKVIRYDESGCIVSRGDYQNGIKHGISEEYSNSNLLIRRDFFSNGILDSSFCWYSNGLISKILINKPIRKEFDFPENSNVLNLIPIFGKEEKLIKQYPSYLMDDIDVYATINKNDFYKNDSIQVQIAKIMCKECESAMPVLIDTLILEDYRIKKFIIGAIVNGYCFSFSCNDGIISKKVLERFKKVNVVKFYMEDFIIVDPYSLEYRLRVYWYGLID